MLLNISGDYMSKVPDHLIERLFNPECDVARMVTFASGSGTNFREAVLESKEPGANYSVDLLVTDKEYMKGKRELIDAINYAEKFDIPRRYINGFQYCGSWAEAQKTAEGVKQYQEKARQFNMELYQEIKKFEEERGLVFDMAILAGYMRLFQGVLLRRFNNKALNVHPALLYKFRKNGERMYTGDRAVFDQLLNGEERTRSSIILVDPETDAGAILASGPWIEYTGKRPAKNEDSEKHQGKQKIISDWPALRFVLRAIANGKFGLHKKKYHQDGNPVVIYENEELPYEGYDMVA
jgi:folate-dependent phosphoribosylglycinamide formyltransferase PurN